jgi:CheY-like chemotaxis protein
VEDDPDDRVLFDIFYAHRDDVEFLPSVPGGVELIQFLERASDIDLPSMIILDQNMPMMNGKQTLKYLKTHERYSDIPVMIYSTYTDNNLICECMDLGAARVVAKPIDDEGYQRMMDEFLIVVEQ